jgi:hypothetical protein
LGASNGRPCYSSTRRPVGAPGNCGANRAAIAPAPLSDLNDQRNVRSHGHVGEDETAVRIGDGLGERVPRRVRALIAARAGGQVVDGPVRDIHEDVVERERARRLVDHAADRRIDAGRARPEPGSCPRGTSAAGTRGSGRAGWDRRPTPAAVSGRAGAGAAAPAGRRERAGSRDRGQKPSSNERIRTPSGHRDLEVRAELFTMSHLARPTFKRLQRARRFGRAMRCRRATPTTCRLPPICSSGAARAAVASKAGRLMRVRPRATGATLTRPPKDELIGSRAWRRGHLGSLMAVNTTSYAAPWGASSWIPTATAFGSSPPPRSRGPFARWAARSGGCSFRGSSSRPAPAKAAGNGPIICRSIYYCRTWKEV